MYEYLCCDDGILYIDSVLHGTDSYTIVHVLGTSCRVLLFIRQINLQPRRAPSLQQIMRFHVVLAIVGTLFAVSNDLPVSTDVTALRVGASTKQILAINDTQKTDHAAELADPNEEERSTRRRRQDPSFGFCTTTTTMMTINPLGRKVPKSHRNECFSKTIPFGSLFLNRSILLLYLLSLLFLLRSRPRFWILFFLLLAYPPFCSSSFFYSPKGLSFRPNYRHLPGDRPTDRQ